MATSIAGNAAKNNNSPIDYTRVPVTPSHACVYLSNGCCGLLPDKIGRRDDDDLAPVVLFEDFDQECPHLAE